MNSTPPPASPFANTRASHSAPEKSPQDVLSIVSVSRLPRSFVHATILMTATLAALTAGPYFWGKSSSAQASSTPEVKPDSSAPTDAPKTNTNTTATATPTPNPAPATGDPSTPTKPPSDLLDKLGESGTKSASPKVNPLDNKGDDLLKDLGK